MSLAKGRCALILTAEVTGCEEKSKLGSLCVGAVGDPGPQAVDLSYCFTCKTGFAQIHEDG